MRDTEVISMGREARARNLRVSLDGLDRPWGAPDPRDWVTLCEHVASETEAYIDALHDLPDCDGIGLWIRFRTASLSMLCDLIAAGDDPELIERLDEAARAIAATTFTKSPRSSV